MTPRHFGHAYGFERDRVEDASIRDSSEDRWVIGTIVGFMLLLGGLGLYAFSGSDRPMIATAPVDETSGQGTRPTLPALPY